MSFGRILCLPAILLVTLIGSGCRAGPAGRAPAIKGGGGAFRVLLNAEPETLNPNAGRDDAAFMVAQNLFNKLVTLDADYQVVPDLAEAWDVSADSRTYTFHLAQGVLWHDGRILTSADVKASLDRLPPSGSLIEPMTSRIERIDAPDSRTVVVRLREPWAPFISVLAWYGTFILPSPAPGSGAWGPGAKEVIGTGPFRFVEWVKGDHLTLSANTAYFRMGPFMDTLTYRFVSASPAIVDLLRTGQADYTVARPAYHEIRTLQGMPGMLVRTFPQPSRYYLGFNLRRKPLGDLRVRRAINMTINRLALVERATMGYGAPALGFYTPAIAWAYNANAVAPGYDINKAASLLDGAGYPPARGGTRFTLDLVTWDMSPFQELALELAAELRTTGIVVVPRLLTPAEANRRIHELHDFDVAILNGSFGPDPDNLSLRFGSKGAQQFMGYSDPEFDAAVAAGARETALDRRAEAYFRAQEILARDLPCAPLVEAAQVIISSDRVTGLPQVEARGLVTFQNYSLVRVRR